MKYDITAKRLRDALDSSGMIPQELSEKSGVGKSSISQYINGSHKPSNIASGKMAEVLDVSPLWLMGFDVPRESDAKRFSAYADKFNELHPSLPTVEEKEILNNYRKLSSTDQELVNTIMRRLLKGKPLAETKRYVYFNRIAAAGTGFLFDDIPSSTVEVPVMENADYVIGVNGSSMEPTYYDGDMLYVQKANTIRQGEIGIFTMCGECFVKELGPDGLISHNKQYPNIPGSEDIRCVGRVIGKVVM